MIIYQQNRKADSADLSLQASKREVKKILRYFRYKNIDKNLNNALEEQYKTLNNCEKRIFRKKKIWQKISTVVSLFIYVTAVTLGIYLLKSISQPSGWLLKLVVGIAKVFAVLPYSLLVVY